MFIAHVARSHTLLMFPQNQHVHIIWSRPPPQKTVNDYWKRPLNTVSPSKFVVVTDASNSRAFHPGESIFWGSILYYQPFPIVEQFQNPYSKRVKEVYFACLYQNIANHGRSHFFLSQINPSKNTSISFLDGLPGSSWSSSSKDFVSCVISRCSSYKRMPQAYIKGGGMDQTICESLKGQAILYTHQGKSSKFILGTHSKQWFSTSKGWMGCSLKPLSRVRATELRSPEALPTTTGLSIQCLSQNELQFAQNQNMGTFLLISITTSKSIQLIGVNPGPSYFIL